MRPQDRLVLVAEIVGGHGVKGRARLRCFTENPQTVGQLNPILNDQGVEFKLKPTGVWKAGIIVEIEGIRRREGVEPLVGTKLYVPRSSLPDLGEEEFYHEDLIGLEARGSEGEKVGVVTAMFNFGGGDAIEVDMLDGQGKVVYPFTKAVVPLIDVANGFVVLEPPAFLPDDQQEQEAEGGGEW